MKKFPNYLAYKISRIFLTVFATVFCGLLCLFTTYCVINHFDLFQENEEASLFNNTKVYYDEEIYSTVDTEIDDVSIDCLIPLGDVFGIKLYTDGVIVSSLQTITVDGQNFCPAQEAGIETGDFILCVEGITVNSNDHFTQLLSENLSDAINLTIKRDDEIFDVTVEPIFDGDYYKLGMWIKDSAAGIGTLTYYDPVTNTFAGLGHGICDSDTGELMILKGGEPSPVEISYIEKGTSGTAGKICGYFTEEESLGTLSDNTETGLYGTLNEIPTGDAIPIATKDEIEIGTAEIYATLETGVTLCYEIEIVEIESYSSTTKNMVIEITDEDLLEITGGIVQGMSGCPIIQNGKIIGAITHVFINDPTMGYAIFIENMLYTNNVED